MADDLYDEFGNYIGPEIDDSDEDGSEEEDEEDPEDEGEDQGPAGPEVRPPPSILGCQGGGNHRWRPPSIRHLAIV